MNVPARFFRGKRDKIGEVILLSSNVEMGTGKNCCNTTNSEFGCYETHISGCTQIQSYNIMLIEWDRGIARRQSIGTVMKEDWRKVETRTKLIALG